MCNNILVLRILYLIKTALNILKFIVPLGLIIKIAFDLYKEILQNNDDKQKTIKIIGNRILAAIIVYCIPTFINLIFALFSDMNIGNPNDVSFATCYDQVDITLIEKLEEEEKLKLQTLEEEKRKQDITTAQSYYAKLKAIEEENAKQKESGGTYNDTTTDLNQQNQVYIQNGTFFAPSYNASNKNTWSGRNCPSGDPTTKGYNNPFGYNNYFWSMLQNFKQALIAAGYNIDYSSQGCRSYATQENYYKTMEKGRAAKPGHSNHGWGIASDVTFYKNSSTKCGSNRTYTNCPGMKWAHENASKYGLTFPLINASYKEDWHIEPLKLKRY